MDECQSLSHTKWDCKYHVMFIPKCRRRTLYVELRRHLGKVFRNLETQRESPERPRSAITKVLHPPIGRRLRRRPQIRVVGCQPGFPDGNS